MLPEFHLICHWSYSPDSFPVFSYWCFLSLWNSIERVLSVNCFSFTCFVLLMGICHVVFISYCLWDYINIRHQNSMIIELGDGTCNNIRHQNNIMARSFDSQNSFMNLRNCSQLIIIVLKPYLYQKLKYFMLFCCVHHFQKAQMSTRTIIDYNWEKSPIEGTPLVSDLTVKLPNKPNFTFFTFDKLVIGYSL